MEGFMKNIFVMLSLALLLAACGGGSTTDTPATTVPPLSSTISGTASKGAPITGSVTLKDSTGATKTAFINSTTGAFSIAVDGMTAPFMLEAGNLYSIANSITTTNINPFTDLCVRSAAGTTVIYTAFADPVFRTALVNKLPAIVAALKDCLNGLYPGTVSATQRDFMNGSLTIDQGVDLVFPRVSIDPLTGIIKFNNQTVVTVSGTNGTATPSATNFNDLKSEIAIAIVTPLPKFFVLDGKTDSGLGDANIKGYNFSTELAPTSVVGSPSSVVIHPNGKFVYVNASDPNNNYTINVTVYSVNSTTGALTSVGTIPTGDWNIHVKIDPTGKFAYLTGEGNISTYSISATTGLLTKTSTILAAAGSSFSTFTVDPNGNFAYVSSYNTINNSSNTSVYSINQTTGELTVIGTASADLGYYSKIAFEPTGKFAYFFTHYNPNVYAYRIDAVTGKLTLISTIVTGIINVGDITIDKSGKYIYMSNHDSNNITAYRINATTGELTNIGAFAVEGVGYIAIDPSGTLLYSLNSDYPEGNVIPKPQTISIFRVNATTGTLTKIGTQIAGSLPEDIAFMPTL